MYVSAKMDYSHRLLYSYIWGKEKEKKSNNMGVGMDILEVAEIHYHTKTHNHTIF